MCVGRDAVEAEVDRLVRPACYEYPEADVLDGHRGRKALNQDRNVVFVVALVQSVQADDERALECVLAYLH